MSMRAWPPVSLASSCREALLRPGRPMASASGEGWAASERPLELALDPIAPRRIERPVPARSQLRDDAARADVGEQLAQRSADRHARRDLRHHADVEALGVELAAGRPRRLRPGARRRAGRSAASSGRRRCESRAGGRRCWCRSSLFSASMRPATCSNWSGSTALSRRRATARRARSTRGGRRLAVLQLEPAAQRAVAFAQLERQGDVAAQLAQLGARQVGVDPAAPAPPVAAAREQRLRRSGRAR